MTIARWVLQALVGTSAVAVAESVASPLAHAEPATEIPGEAAIFARFSDLALPETEERLVALLKDPNLSERLVALSRRLAEAASPDELEALALPLVKGATPDDVNTTLAAIMLDQYQSSLQAALERGTMQPSDVMEALIARDTALTTAVYGHRTSRRRHVTRR